MADQTGNNSDPADASQNPETIVKTNITWMPMAREHTVPLAALSVCHPNIERGCDFHKERKWESYYDAWKSPGPSHCQRARKQEPDPIVHSDRLGASFDCNAFE